MTSQFVETSRTTVDFDENQDQSRAEIVVKGRNVEIPDHFRVYVAQKLARLERLDRSIRLLDVELKHANNRRQRKSCQQIDITVHGRGPVVRGEARADSFYAAFEAALDRLESRLRRGKDRRNVSYGDKTPLSVAAATAAATLDPEQLAGAFDRDGTAEPDHRAATGHDHEHDHEPGRIVRTKEHAATPMSVDDALYEMELVGHDFFLFHDKETEQPSVVYRRHAYDYGLIRLV
ncbi:ribosome hibernation-promoting factor, HPF/YfiA family [[Mycobacterium] nativiensis]|uniref:Ribosome hibernation promoting factor n=1 Tax=[Mycobacterium] nativiensis TaxID=2855503 RepID=A0ABU5XWR2_9MYCO|nr:ribosome-associated translation inhibitor RaiA [Mycolicibacter sp. MYC340]MEB3032228.1 ribosome-associated translation inhibitor RaiA [Mycolicibacter sp. MYC340]